MLKDITLGQYFPDDTPIHRLDPRTKLILTVVYIAALFMVGSVGGYVLTALWLAAAAHVSHIKPKALFKGLRPLIFLMVFTAIINLFFTSGEDYLLHWRFIKITYTGLKNAVVMVVRVMLLVSGTFMLTYTTSPLSITDGLERLLSPLKKLHVPVYELSLMMSIALRFIPTLIEETDRIMSAQKARGADLETGSLVERAKALLPLLIPLFVSAFRRADELALAMECRCYNGGEGRTRMKQLRMERRDAVALLLGAALVAGVLVLGRLGL
ncbi:MAG: energy-coupling factor transporter transmembrane protein EcfT [Oscillospiraceae bacterium]|nr:energy-coupling factor transporter transmembrane protein EcfT [Oscillospiraceae bacterium]